MFARIANILGWVGVALVFGAVAARFLRPEQMDLWWWLAISGLVAILVYVLSQWREIAATFTRRQARYGTLSLVSVIGGRRHPGRHQLHRAAAEQALGSDGVAGVHALRSDAQGDPGA